MIKYKSLQIFSDNKEFDAAVHNEFAMTFIGKPEESKSYRPSLTFSEPYEIDKLIIWLTEVKEEWLKLRKDTNFVRSTITTKIKSDQEMEREV